MFDHCIIADVFGQQAFHKWQTSAICYKPTKEASIYVHRPLDAVALSTTFVLVFTLSIFIYMCVAGMLLVV